MRIAYFDCFSGASGDMILGALLDSGLTFDVLRDALKGLALEGFELSENRVTRHGLSAAKFDVARDASIRQPHRHLHNIEKIINDSAISAGVKTNAVRIFRRLAEAEAAVHDTTVEKVHFHEVGAIDAIVDVVGACVGLEALGIEAVHCSPIPTGSGTVRCEHGVMPVPAPATAKLLQGIPLAQTDEVGELTTPTGAAILTTLSLSFGPMPAMTIEAAGYGAGQRDGKHRPNLLRVFVGTDSDGTDSDGGETDQVILLQANLDDATGEVIGHATERLLSSGALDVYTTPIFMKKNRPATLLTVMSDARHADALRQLLFEETTTFGIREWTVRRAKLSRRRETVETAFGPIRIKIGTRGETVLIAKPEYEDCRAAASAGNVTLRDVMEAAMRAWKQRNEA